MKRSNIQEHSSVLVRELIGKAESISKLGPTVVGELRELFMSNLLKKFLQKQFEVGTGVIVNQQGEKSPQTDIIISDTRVLMPLIKEQNLGVYPAECVLATIEVKSQLKKDDIICASNKAKLLFEKIYHPSSSIYGDLHKFTPMCYIVGFYDDCHFNYDNRLEIKNWIESNAKYLSGVCLIDKFSWLNVRVRDKIGSLKLVDKNNEETKAFIGVMIDNIWVNAEERLLYAHKKHRDWVGIYIRDQSGIRKHFEQIQKK